MEDIIYKYPDDFEILNAEEYKENVCDHFLHLPNVSNFLIEDAQVNFNKIEEMLYSTPAVVDIIKSFVPNEAFNVLLTAEQKGKLATGALKLMTRENGTLMANLIDPKTGKIVSALSLEKVSFTPDIAQAMTSFSTQMQLAQIAEQIQLMQIAIDEVRQGQEFDRLALAYSCQQKFLQAMNITNAELKRMALLNLVADAEDSRNMLMLSQKSMTKFIQSQPEDNIGKLFSSTSNKTINSKIQELRDNLSALNMVSLVEAMSYQEMGETVAAQISLKYYADYINEIYVSNKKFIERLDLIDPLPNLYWSKTLPQISMKIQALPCNCNFKELRGK